MTRLLPLAVLAVALGVACATNPATGKRQVSLMSEAQEISMGQEQDLLVKKEMGIYNDPALQEYVSNIGLNLARVSERPNLPWHFTVVDVPAINAFALPGGYIYITRGILPFLDNEAELAGVLGHEIGHVTARHAAQQYTRSIGGTIGLAALGILVPAARPFGDLASSGLGLLFLKYGRGDELQADQLGVKYESAGGWDPAGVPGMLSTLGRLDEAQGEKKGVPNWLSTHPDPLSRVEEITPQVQKVKEAAPNAPYRTDREALLQRVDGLVYGDSPEQGIARGSAFLHPVLKFRIDFPKDWEIMNSPSQVVAKAPNAEIYMLLEPAEQPQGRTMEDVAANAMGRAGFRLRAGDRTTIDGLEAFIGLYEGELEGLGKVMMRAAHIAYQRDVYMLAGMAGADLFPQAESAILASIRSFKKLSDAEAAAIRPNRIDVYVVRSGDTWQSIADRSGGGVIKASTLAVMNNAQPSSQPPVGMRIKIVVGG